MKTRWGVYRNLLLTMTLGGLWHGAAWHFVLWGFIHGAWLSIERLLGIRPAGEPSRLTASYLARASSPFTESWHCGYCSEPTRSASSVAC